MVRPHCPGARGAQPMTTTDLDVADHHAAGALADELPYWGWLPDDRTCLTRRGELVTLARLTPTVVDGHTPASSWTPCCNRWQRMLSGIDARTRMYVYLLAPAGDVPPGRHRRVGGRRPRATQAARVPRSRASNRSTPLSRGATTRACPRPPPASTTRRGGRNYLQTWMTAAADSQRSDLLPGADRGRDRALSATG